MPSPKIGFTRRWLPARKAVPKRAKYPIHMLCVLTSEVLDTHHGNAVGVEGVPRGRLVRRSGCLKKVPTLPWERLRLNGPSVRFAAIATLPPL